MYIRIATNHYVPQCLIETLEFTCNGVVARMKHFYFPPSKHSFQDLQVGLDTRSLAQAKNHGHNTSFYCPCKIDSLD